MFKINNSYIVINFIILYSLGPRWPSVKLLTVNGLILVEVISRVE